jgi:hypothetical protein
MSQSINQPCSPPADLGGGIAPLQDAPEIGFSQFLHVLQLPHRGFPNRKRLVIQVLDAPLNVVWINLAGSMQVCPHPN